MWKRIPSGRNIECKSTGGRVADMYQEHNGGRGTGANGTGDDWPKMMSERVWDQLYGA